MRLSGEGGDWVLGDFYKFEAWKIADLSCPIICNIHDALSVPGQDFEGMNEINI